MEAFDFALDDLDEIGAGEGEAHDVGADDHGEARHFREAGEEQRKTEGQGRDGRGALEMLEEPRKPAGEQEAESGGADPETERLGGNPEDVGPRRAEVRFHPHHADDDGEDDDAEDIVEDGGGQDGDAFGGIHLAAFAEDAGRDADRGGGADGAQKEGVRGNPGLGQTEPDGAAGAEEEGEHHAADADDGAGDGITQKRGQIGFQAGQEEQDDRSEDGKRVEFGRNRRAGGREGEQRADQGPMEAAQGIRTDQHADDQFAQHAGQVQPAAQPVAAHAGEDNQETQLNNEQDLRGEHAGSSARLSRSTDAGLRREWWRPAAWNARPGR